jgi:hypothetical protein
VDKDKDKDTLFQFHWVWGTTKEPPSWSAAMLKNHISHKGQMVWETVINRYVEKVQSVSPIPYSERSWKYAYYLRKQSSLEHWAYQVDQWTRLGL